jgi:hypothetical protein
MVQASILEPVLIQRFSREVKSRNSANIYYEDEYAVVSFMDSIPCVKLKLTGIPICSDHFQLVYEKFLEKVNIERKNYFRLHMMTDCSKAGVISTEDVEFYRSTVLPEIVKAGVKYHAVVMPESLIGKLFMKEIVDCSKTIRSLKIEFFKSAFSAYTWLRKA